MKKKREETGWTRARRGGEYGAGEPNIYNTKRRRHPAAAAVFHRRKRDDWQKRNRNVEEAKEYVE